MVNKNKLKFVAYVIVEEIPMMGKFDLQPSEVPSNTYCLWVANPNTSEQHHADQLRDDLWLLSQLSSEQQTHSLFPKHTTYIDVEWSIKWSWKGVLHGIFHTLYEDVA